MTEAAERRGVKRATVLAAIKSGRLSARKVGQTYILRVADVDQVVFAPPSGQGRRGHGIGGRPKKE